MLPFEPGAAEEFEAAATWYERERTDYGELFMSAVRGSVDRAARFPQSGIQVHGFGREGTCVASRYCVFPTRSSPQLLMAAERSLPLLIQAASLATGTIA